MNNPRNQAFIGSYRLAKLAWLPNFSRISNFKIRFMDIISYSLTDIEY